MTPWLPLIQRFLNRGMTYPYKAVGVDLGLASLAVTRDGEKIAPPKFLRSALKKLRRLQRALVGHTKPLGTELSLGSW